MSIFYCIASLKYSSCIQMTHNESVFAMAGLHLDKAEIMFTTPDENFDKPNITGSMYFDIDNIDEVWEDIKGKSKVHYAIEDKEWQKRQFAIYDNNGYILEFGQDIT